MRELLPAMRRWNDRGETAALATVVKIWGSAPRQPGARMAVSSSDEIVGSVSGGCVEGEVVREAREVIASGAPKMLRFTVTHDDAWSVGLSCGGTIEIFVERWDPEGSLELAELARSLEGERLVALATVVAGEGLGRHRLLWRDGAGFGSLGSVELDAAADRLLEARFTRLDGERVELDPQAGPGALFVETFPPSPVLFIVGAVHVALPLLRMAREIGFRTVVIDPRSGFATPERFAEADELIHAWPQEVLGDGRLNEAGSVAVLTHDLKIDVPALEVALRSPAGYVGALGSKKTHARRVRALEEAGLAAEEIARVHAPIGLDLGGRRPEEIALAILAEIVSERYADREVTGRRPDRNRVAR